MSAYDSLKSLAKAARDGQVHLVSKFANQTHLYVSSDRKSHYFLFGRETKGLAEDFMRQHEGNLDVNDEHVRSLNALQYRLHDCL